MSHILTLEVSDEVHETLVKVAQRSGQTLEAVAAEYLAVSMHPVQDDPLEEFIGGFVGNVPDWTEKSDSYLGQALLTETRGSSETSVPDG